MRERMVHRHQTPFLFAPFEHREIHHPQQREFVLVAQSQTGPHLQTQFTQLFTRLHGILATHYQYQIARHGLHRLLQAQQYFLRIELIHTGFYATVFLHTGIYQSFRPDLTAFHEVRQLVQLLTGI